ncbi:DUF6417 family protein [Streptomyces sp. NPDC102270]|uniref:DUF6417 family protein n=1 Tax=Streptomyces sp. NPDC102270 TaxID=3366150 RepID=UPI003810E454
MPPDGELTEEICTAWCDHEIKRWRPHLTHKQITSVTCGLWLHEVTGSATAGNCFGREYGVVRHSSLNDAVRSAASPSWCDFPPPRVNRRRSAGPLPDTFERLPVLSLDEVHELLYLLRAVAQEDSPLSGQADRLVREISTRVPLQE